MVAKGIAKYLGHARPYQAPERMDAQAYAIIKNEYAFMQSQGFASPHRPFEYFMLDMDQYIFSKERNPHIFEKYQGPLADAFAQGGAPALIAKFAELAGGTLDYTRDRVHQLENIWDGTNVKKRFDPNQKRGVVETFEERVANLFGRTIYYEKVLDAQDEAKHQAIRARIKKPTEVICRAADEILACEAKITAKENVQRPSVLSTVFDRPEDLKLRIEHLVESCDQHVQYMTQMGGGSSFMSLRYGNPVERAPVTRDAIVGLAENGGFPFKGLPKDYVAVRLAMLSGAPAENIAETLESKIA